MTTNIIVSFDTRMKMIKKKKILFWKKRTNTELVHSVILIHWTPSFTMFLLSLELLVEKTYKMQCARFFLLDLTFLLKFVIWNY